MRIALKTTLFAAMLMPAALPAAATTSVPLIGHDPLMAQIQSLQLKSGSGITGVTRLGSGQTIALNGIDPLAPLQPIGPVASKPAEKKEARRKERSAGHQLKKMSGERGAAWSGRD